MKSLKIIVGLFVLFFSFNGFSQGSLTPPGAPTPTMKTLDQVEARVPVSGSTNITQSGSYYLTGNVTNGGITISASDVILDLNGHAMNPITSGSAGIKLIGTTNAPLYRVIVKNGSISHFVSGIEVQNILGCRFENLIIGDNTSKGFFANADAGICSGNIIEKCIFSQNTLYGIEFYPRNGGQCSGNVIRDCSIFLSNKGIFLYGGAECSGNQIVDCLIAGNSQEGIYLYNWQSDCNANVIRSCTVQGNTLYGIYLYSRGGGGQCDGNLIVDCSFQNNEGGGIYLNGIEGGQCKGNRIEGNIFRENGTYAIEASGNCAHNLYVRNSSFDSQYNFSVSDCYGPVVSDSGELSSSGKASHPWANFCHPELPQ